MPRRKSPVVWARWPPLAMRLGDLRPPRAPPVLVISLPRSGSSWAGEILGAGPEALYLREPLTQTHLARGGGAAVVPVDAGRLPPGYAQAADRAFRGIPSFHPGIVRLPAQWGWWRRPDRRVVVKEVNPLALGWLRARYRPAIVYLVRHPVAVADSYQRLGWADVDPRERLRDAARAGSLPELEGMALAGFWERMGAFQAAVTRLALQVLDGPADRHLVRYEDLCRDAEGRYRALYARLGLRWDDSVAEAIARRGRSGPGGERGAGEDNPYSTRRRTQAMGEAWRERVDPADAEAVMAAYRRFGLGLYDED